MLQNEIKSSPCDNIERLNTLDDDQSVTYACKWIIVSCYICRFNLDFYYVKLSKGKFNQMQIVCKVNSLIESSNWEDTTKQSFH